MKLDETINGYRIIRKPESTGNCIWSFAKKGSKEYFIKQFLKPVYSESGSPAIVAKKKAECEKFESFHRKLIEAFRIKGEESGNIIFPIDFFRFETKFYKVAEKISVYSDKLEQIVPIPLDKKMILLKTVAHSLGILHRCNIVHGDLKRDNILIKETEKAFATKLIDFDSSYFSGEPPEDRDSNLGDPVYYSPEIALYIKGATTGSNITLKSDIFALGLIFWEYLTGSLPLGVTATQPANQIAIKDGRLTVNSPSVPKELCTLVNSMLLLKAEERPTISEIFENLKKISVTTTSTPSTGKLTISMGKKDKTTDKPEIIKEKEPKEEPSAIENKLKGTLFKKIK